MNNERRLNNTIYLMHVITQNYMRRHHANVDAFLKLNRDKKVLNYISECPDVFDGLPMDEMQRELEEYIDAH
ncbi:MAG: hypothetical protein LBR77_03630 [Lachnospiraceae bacterium]|jgi:hypothetical protein|nr:hypothetical protein [Lachnospiraceae bacterium]